MGKKVFINRGIINIILSIMVLIVIVFIKNDVTTSQNILKKNDDLKKLVTRRIKTNKKVVALTFDDGPDSRYTPEILRILRENKVHATFFIVGKNAKANMNIVSDEIAQGNEIENHTFTHPHFENLSEKQDLNEVKENEEFLYNNFSVKPIFFRPPRGICSTNVIKDLLKDNIKTVYWTICFEHKAQPDPIKRAGEIVKSVKPGYIILAHDGILNRSKTVKGIPYIIKDLKKRGYSFVTLKQLFKYKIKNRVKLNY